MLIFLTMQMKVRQPMSPIGVHRLGLLHTVGLRQSVVELTARKSIHHRLSPLDGDPGSVCNMCVVVVCTLSPFVVYRCSRDALNFHSVSPCALRSRSGHACLCRTCRGRFALIELMVAERRRGRRSRRAESEKMATRRSCSSVRPSRPTTTTSRASARPSRGWSGPAGWPAPSRPTGGESGHDKDSAKTGHRLCISHSPPFF